jgi:NAD(P)-dependent dehydrogenase (short-subunit alcohol dehydrogenase family)
LPEFDLSGRTVLVAGASAGLGAGFARRLGEAGARVVLGARRVERVEALAAELPEAIGVPLDITDEASVIAAYDAAEARFGTVQGIVANAGVGTGGRSTDTAAEGLKTVIDTNLLGSYLVCREGARRLIASGSREREDGRIVLIGSTTAVKTGMGDAMYAATKAGLEHLGRQFAREWVRQGINVNTVHPGWIATEINTDWTSSERGQAEIKAQHRRRLQETDALDEMVLYLLSAGAKQITGASIVIDDGQSL